jgi:transposase
MGAPKLTADDRSQICTLYRISDTSLRDLAGRFGVSHQAVSDVLRKVGVPRRERGEPSRSRTRYLSGERV